MGVVRTDRWLIEEGLSPEKMCNKLMKHFPHSNGIKIYHHLVKHGMYKKQKITKSWLIKWMKSIQWKEINNVFQTLRTRWKGNDIPIYIFPVDETNQNIKTSLRGKSGLAFKEKLFIFLPLAPKKREIQALIIHEYNHSCRLLHLKQTEKDTTLLDTIVMEGLAESAVNVMLGEEYVSEWTRYYDQNEAIFFYKRFIKPYLHVKHFERKANQLLYGKGFLPKMLGYNVGYHIVQDFLKRNKDITIDDLIKIDSHKIIAGAISFH
ncbi:DUF2268 domain-containing protein [Bacillus aquiflavi]|uniref:DUF2268 domain-containing protein n=1 Tax=Bacillus aquiflavi TaxID=2672567 RepID=A0A6B3VUC8_9BACI|nr:DUF2268 domain-containing protein [Bacillus aquiflavi]MBA4536460.1 DUF2268 domain-containing protein [Bacillus aquiflavi]NEY80828.1 DUF2268 domain-containing protein [Bacillus aquiflavi]UAC49081.1 DUF2268 domain-containing protein [Bacillus aquiflavi]